MIVPRLLLKLKRSGCNRLCILFLSVVAVLLTFKYLHANDDLLRSENVAVVIDRLKSEWQPYTKACKCSRVREAEDNKLPFCYSKPGVENLVGKRFKCTSRSVLKKLNLQKIHPKTNIVNPDRIVTFAAALKSNNLGAINRLISEIQKNFPRSPVIIYDLRPKKLKNTTVFQTAVEKVLLKDANMDQFPEQDAVTHYGRVVWLRPSLPLISNKLLDQVSYQISNMSSNSAQKSPFIFLLNKRPVSSVFHLGFLPYFPMSIETRGKINFRNSSAVWLDRHPSTFEIIRWLVLCSVEENCWQCRNIGDERLECLPYLLTYLLYQQSSDVSFYSFDIAEQIGYQESSSSECHFKCVILIFTFILLAFALLVCVALFLATRIF